MSATVYVNGIEYDFSSVTVQIGRASAGLNAGVNIGGVGAGAGGGVTLFKNVTYGVKAIEYSHKLTRTKVRGTHRQPIGRTPGEYEASGSITLYKRYANDFIDTVTNNGATAVFDSPFDVTITFATDRDAASSAGGIVSSLFGSGIQSSVVKDLLLSCFITDDGDSHSQGTNPLEVKLALDIMSVIKNGRLPIGNMLPGTSQ